MSLSTSFTLPTERFLPGPDGEPVLIFGTTHRSRDLLCTEVDQRILVREDGSALAVLRYYRPVQIDHIPEHYPLACANNEPTARTKQRFLVLSRGVLSLEPFPNAAELFIPRNTTVREAPGPG